MNIFTGRIENFSAGDNVGVTRNLEDVPAGQLVQESRLTVKENFWDTDYIFQKVITTVNSPSEGVITDATPGGTASLYYHLTAADTVLLRELFEYFYDIQVTTDALMTYTPEHGIIIANPSITD